MIYFETSIHMYNTLYNVMYVLRRSSGRLRVGAASACPLMQQPQPRSPYHQSVFSTLHSTVTATFSEWQAVRRNVNVSSRG